MNPEELYIKGACVDKDPNLWFPDRSRGPNGGSEAKAICSGCPVRQPCLDFALGSNQTFGVWGGTTPAERRRMK